MIHFKSCESKVIDKPWLEPIAKDFRDIHITALSQGKIAINSSLSLDPKTTDPYPTIECYNTQHICDMQQPLSYAKPTYLELMYDTPREI